MRTELIMSFIKLIHTGVKFKANDKCSHSFQSYKKFSTLIELKVTPQNKDNYEIQDGILKIDILLNLGLPGSRNVPLLPLYVQYLKKHSVTGRQTHFNFPLKKKFTQFVPSTI